MTYILQPEFNNVAQRMVNCLGLCLADFNYLEDNQVSVKSQQQMYDLCSEIIKALYDKPDLLKLPVEPDKFYENWMCNNERPQLIKLFRKIYKKIFEFYRFMFLCGLNGRLVNNSLLVNLSESSLKVKKEYTLFLAELKIDLVIDNNILTISSKKYDDIFKAWKLLSKVSLDNQEMSTKSIFDFACCLYNKDFSYFLTKIESEFALGNNFFIPFLKELKEKNYEIFVDRSFSHLGVLFSYRFLDKVSGFSITVDYRKRNQIFFELKNGIGLKRVLEDFDSLKPNIQDFLCTMFFTCRKCMQCTKGKKINIYACKINHNHKDYVFCPLWPKSNWYSMNKETFSNMLEIIELQKIYQTN